MTLKFSQAASQLISNSVFRILCVTLNFFRVASQLVPVLRILWIILDVFRIVSQFIPVFSILRITLDVFRVRVDCIRVSSFQTFIDFTA